MKNRYLLALKWELWELDKEYGYYTMRHLDGGLRFSIWHLDINKGWMHNYCVRFDTLEDAKKDLIRRVTKDCWTILTEEQAQRLEVLV